MKSDQAAGSGAAAAARLMNESQRCREPEANATDIAVREMISMMHVIVRHESEQTAGMHEASSRKIQSHEARCQSARLVRIG